MSDAPARAPWNPDPRWADPLIGLLLTLALGVVYLNLAARARPLPPPPGPGAAGRIVEVQEGLRLRMPRLQGAAASGAAGNLDPWDRALKAVLLSEEGRGDEARALRAGAPLPPGPAAEAFSAAYAAAYEGGPLPDPGTRALASTALGEGLAARLMDARLTARGGGDAEAARQAAWRAFERRLVAFVLFGGLVLALFLGGFAFGIWLLATGRWHKAEELPAWGFSGRAMALVILGWFLAFAFISIVMGAATHGFPDYKPHAFFCAYLLHASVGVALVARAEGTTATEVFRRVLPLGQLRQLARSLALTGGFLALAVFCVTSLAFLLGPLLAGKAHPQQELLRMIQGLKGGFPTVVLFATAALLAPVYEELLFRGVLLPWASRRWGRGRALLASGLLFGAMHLQPLALPTLATLGLVLGLSVIRTRSIWCSVGVHMCWNGSLFLLMRLVG